MYYLSKHTVIHTYTNCTRPFIYAAHIYTFIACAPMYMSMSPVKCVCTHIKTHTEVKTHTQTLHYFAIVMPNILATASEMNRTYQTLLMKILEKSSTFISRRTICYTWQYWYVAVTNPLHVSSDSTAVTQTSPPWYSNFIPPPISCDLQVQTSLLFDVVTSLIRLAYEVCGALSNMNGLDWHRNSHHNLTQTHIPHPVAYQNPAVHSEPTMLTQCLLVQMCHKQRLPINGC